MISIGISGFKWLICESWGTLVNCQSFRDSEPFWIYRYEANLSPGLRQSWYPTRVAQNKDVLPTVISWSGAFAAAVKAHSKEAYEVPDAEIWVQKRHPPKHSKRCFAFQKHLSQNWLPKPKKWPTGKSVPSLPSNKPAASNCPLAPDTTAPQAVVNEKKWRFGYVKHVVRQTQLASGSEDTALGVLAMPTFFLISKGGAEPIGYFGYFPYLSCISKIYL